MTAVKWALIIGSVLMVGYILLQSRGASAMNTTTSNQDYFSGIPPAAAPPFAPPGLKYPETNAIEARRGRDHF